jgi:hypothetical protein
VKTVLSSVFDPKDNLATLKMAALYCDQVIIPWNFDILLASDEPIKPTIQPGDTINVKVAAKFQTLSDEIRDAVKPLVDERIVVFGEPEEFDRERMLAFADTFDDLVPRAEGGHTRFKWNPSLFDTDGSYDQVRDYFSFLAGIALEESLQHESPILTDAQPVNDLLLHFLAKDRLAKRVNVAQLKSNFLTQRVVSEILPNVKNASVHDILEVRYKLRNELDDFRISMSKLSGTIKSNPWSDDLKNDVDRIIESQIKPNLSNLKKSLRTSNLQLVKRVFRNFKEFHTYLPLVGTVLLNVEPSIAALASIGVAGFEALYHTLLERRKIRDTSGLTFLLKASRKF